eukprot:1268905-Rhodomonas_salina.1
MLLGGAGMIITKAEPGGEILVKGIVAGGAVAHDGRIQARDPYRPTVCFYALPTPCDHYCLARPGSPPLGTGLGAYYS